MISISLVAEVSAPAINGQTLQATAVRVQGNQAYATYNYQGDRRGGSV
ncbi:MAG: hypothetical protein AABY83_04060 [Pseudomonadota bacterium]